MSSSAQCHNVLNVMCPMHLILDRDGLILFAGPTAQKLLPDQSMIGRRFLELFDIKRPREISTPEALRETAGIKLHLQFRRPPHRDLKAVLMEGPETGQMIINLSFGISVVDAVQDYKLTAADFAPTDLTIEMLYLVEAKSAAMEASRQLNRRLQGARVAAEEQALSDTLTGLRNRRGMDRMLADLIANGEDFALMHMDLDYFKAVNDTMGHAAGDYVLQQVARIMLNEVRSHDTVARVGGDEFVLLLRSVDRPKVIDQIATRIIARVSEPILFEGQICNVSSSAGTTLSRHYEVVTADQLLGDADVALYESKSRGRRQHTFFSEDLRDQSGGAKTPLPRAQAPQI
ncbi:GGDEF domain-containing protein [Roseobacter sinensis]|uniref:GGDEF domain-containing protein n=1 Tax=Roseobacter sinensis TaxID=2931391 RepID=A0ABT3BC99_9RHOB|nr:GGDEF domain-containing protein [Roseobacter sp. WL0113]MCV3271207.1 GGDEF domain-containing protein [Roseobacter sp. WL0113]